MVRLRNINSIALLLPLLAAVLAFGWLLQPVPAQAQSCPVQLVDKGIDCSGGGSSWSYCGSYPTGQCMAEPTCPGWQGAAAAKTRLECTTCSCACPRDLALDPSGNTDQRDCTATTDNNCQPHDLGCRDTYNRQYACASQSKISGGNCGDCLPGYLSCGGSEVCEQYQPESWCQSPDVWDECTDTCTFKYVLANPTVDQAPQPANVSLAGNLQISRTGPTADNGYLYLPDGGRVRVDAAGATEINVGNYDPGATGFKFNLFGGLYSREGISLIPDDDSVFPGEEGTLEAQQVCLGDETACRKTWPVGLPEGVIPDNVTLRYDNTGGSWQYSEFLRNDDNGLAIGVPVGQSAGWLLDARSDTATLPVLNLNDRVGTLWTGVRLARILGGDANKERWFLGMDDVSPNLQLQYDGNVDNRFLTVTPSGFIGVDRTVPADKLHVYGGSLRLEGEGSNDATIKLTGESQNTRAWQLGFDGNTGDFRMSRNLANLDNPTLSAQYATSRVGINSSDPGFPLDVWSQAGTAMLRLVQDTDSSLWTGIQLARYTTADGAPVEKWYLGMPDQVGGGDKFYIRRNGAANDFTIDTNGWVGIGDTSPEAQLTVQGPNSGLRIENTQEGNSPTLTLHDEGEYGFRFQVDDNDANKLKLASGDSTDGFTDRLVVTQDGLVGLNNPAPVTVLDANNSEPGTVTIARLNQDFAGTESLGWQLDRQGALKWFAGMAAGSESYRIVQGGTPNLDRVVISNSGNVGVGVDPANQYRLDVDGGRIRADSLRLTSDVDGISPAAGGGEYILGAKNTDGDLVWVSKPVGLPTSGLVDGQTLRYDGAGGTWVPTLNLYNSGQRVGINESAPGYPLDIAPAGASTDLPMVRLHGPDSGRRWSGLRLDRGKDNEQWLIGMDDADEDLIVRRAGTDNPLVIQSGSGNVGLGNTAPGYRLSVGDRFRVDGASGHVGIGSSVPVSNLGISYQNNFTTTTDTAGLQVEATSATAAGTADLVGGRISATATAARDDVYGMQVEAANNAPTKPGQSYTIGGQFSASTNSTGVQDYVYGIEAIASRTAGDAASQTRAINALATGPGYNIGALITAGGGSRNRGLHVVADENYFSGSLGIGTEDISFPLDIQSGSGTATVRILQRSTPQRQGLKLDKDTTESWFIGMEPNDDDLEFQSEGNVRAVIQADGRLGVNKNDPTSTLDVAGMATVNGLKLPVGAADGLVMKSNATGEAYWGVVEYATDCTGGKFSHLSQVDGAGDPVGTGGTPAAYDGNRGGYVAMNAVCGSDGTSGKPYHICTSEDILRTIRCAPGVLSAVDGQRAWVSAGPPGYTTPAVNDCNGWTDNNSSASKAYGTYWEFNALTGGAGFGTDCKSTQRVACCTPL